MVEKQTVIVMLCMCYQNVILNSLLKQRLNLMVKKITTSVLIFNIWKETKLLLSAQSAFFKSIKTFQRQVKKRMPSDILNLIRIIVHFPTF